jgi:hypothetical protein
LAHGANEQIFGPPPVAAEAFTGEPVKRVVQRFFLFWRQLLGRSKFACLQRQKPAMFAQMPLFVYRHFIGAVCTTSSDGRFALFSAPSTAAFSVASRLPNSSDILLRASSEPPTAVGRLMRASGSKAAGPVVPWLQRTDFWLK